MLMGYHGIVIIWEINNRGMGLIDIRNVTLMGRKTMNCRGFID